MASYLPDLRKDNITLYTVPLFWMITLSPRIYSMTTYNCLNPKQPLDDRQPREWSKVIETSQTLDITTKGRLRRAEAASLNGFENFGPFAAAVVAGSAAKVDPFLLNTLALGYLATRVLYNYVYVTGETPGRARVRALTYMGSMGLMFSMFIAAGNKLRSSILWSGLKGDV